MSTDGCASRVRVCRQSEMCREVKLKQGKKPPVTDEFQWFIILRSEKTEESTLIPISSKKT